VNSFKTGDRILSAPDEATTGSQWHVDFKKLMCWVFAGTSLRYITISLKSIEYVIYQHYTPLLLRNLLVAPTFSVVMASISGVACWTIWKGKSSARGWAIAASLLYVLVFLRQFLISLRPAWDHNVSALFIGIVGLVVFLWRDKHVNS
jgi:hypothetical protein